MLLMQVNNMKFKEFKRWCNDRAFDGCWGSIEALSCISIMETINQKPFWKREKIWKDVYEASVVNHIINPINKMIKERGLSTNPSLMIIDC